MSNLSNVIPDFRECLIRKLVGYSKVNNALEVNRWIISIQASENHYCYPRKNLNIWEYESFEIALWCKKEEGMLDINKLFPHIIDEKQYDQVLDWVEVETIQKLWEHLHTCYPPDNVSDFVYKSSYNYDEE